MGMGAHLVEVMGVEGLDAGAANHGAYRGLVHGIVSRPMLPPATEPQCTCAAQQQ